MKNMKIVLASDHGGFQLKKALTEYLLEKGSIVIDRGTYREEAVDYPDIADALCMSMKYDPSAPAILICGTGIGISMAANRFKWIRAALCTDVLMARLAREHNNANVLVLGGRTTDIDVAKQMVETFFTTAFEGGRHARRVEKLGV